MPSRAMIVVGGGTSSRFGGDKLLVEVGGQTLMEHTIDAVIGHVDVCVVVCRPEITQEVAAKRPDITVTSGGPSRTRSEIAGLAAIGSDVDLIGIHDAARPAVSADMVEKLFETALTEGGALPLLTYERLMVHRRTHQPITGVRGAQTPQVFRAPELLTAYDKAARADFAGHDTAEVMERFADVRIVGITGDPANVKVTYPQDLEKLSSRLSGPSRT